MTTWHKCHHIGRRKERGKACDACGGYTSHTGIHKGFWFIFGAVARLLALSRSDLI